MKCLLIRDLALTKELSGEDLAAVRGGMTTGGCVVTPVPTVPAVPFNGDPRAMIEAIYALIPVYTPMDPTRNPGPIYVPQ
jgi:hypothetical protein